MGVATPCHHRTRVVERNLKQHVSGTEREPPSVAVHARYLHDLFVRRTCFDNSDKDRHSHFMNILQVRLPGRLAVWFTRDRHDEQMIEDIVHVDRGEAWPHNDYKEYSVSAKVTFERLLLPRDFRTLEHECCMGRHFTFWQKYESRKISDMRHARQIVNRIGCIVDFHNKEAGWFSCEGARKSWAYVQVPEDFNTRAAR